MKLKLQSGLPSVAEIMAHDLWGKEVKSPTPRPLKAMPKARKREKFYPPLTAGQLADVRTNAPRPKGKLVSRVRLEVQTPFKLRFKSKVKLKFKRKR